MEEVLGECIMSCLLPVSVFLCFLSFLHKEIYPSHTSAQLSSGPVKVMIIRQSKIVQGMKQQKDRKCRPIRCLNFSNYFVLD